MKNAFLLVCITLTVYACFISHVLEAARQPRVVVEKKYIIVKKSLIATHQRFYGKEAFDRLKGVFVSQDLTCYGAFCEQGNARQDGVVRVYFNLRDFEHSYNDYRYQKNLKEQQNRRILKWFNCGDPCDLHMIKIIERFYEEGKQRARDGKQ